MKNAIIKYDETLEGTYNNIQYQAYDYTSKYFKQLSLLNILKDTNYIDYYELTDNQTIEQVSYILYDTPDYWDILLLINNMDPLFDMVYNFDVINDATEEKLNEYFQNFSVTINQDTKDRLKNEMLDINFKKNESKRNIKVIRPSMITDFIKILLELDFTDIESVKEYNLNNPLH